MDIRFLGAGGPGGWPQAGCRCASCMRATAAGRVRGPGAVLVDGILRFDPGRPARRTGPDGAPQATAAGRAPGAAGGYLIEPLPGGWDVTGPDGGRLLIAAGPGAVPDPPAGTGPFDVVLLDLLGSAAQLGALRARGLAGADSVAAVLYADHRISAEAELARRGRLWRAVVPADGDTLSTPASTARASTARAAALAGALLAPHRTLILGGARSGKSREAELRLAAEPEVTYLAAGPWAGGSWTGTDGRPDTEWAGRVAAHQARRPGWWRTDETADVAGALHRLRGAVLVDGIGTWLAAVMDEAGAWRTPDSGGTGAAGGPGGTGGTEVARRIAARLDDLVAAWRDTSARVVAVSDQVGSGIVPATPAGRQFRDQLGWLNQRLAAESEETVLVVAGRVLSLST